MHSKDKNVGYNIADGGEGSNGGMFKSHSHSEATRQKISNSVSKYNQKHRKGKTMLEIVGNNYINGMRGKPAKNKGLIKIYNEDLKIVKYILKTDDISNYPGFRFGGPTRNTSEIDLSYLQDVNYQKQLKERFKGTRFVHNDELKLCKRVKEESLQEFLNNG